MRINSLGSVKYGGCFESQTDFVFFFFHGSESTKANSHSYTVVEVGRIRQGLEYSPSPHANARAMLPGVQRQANESKLTRTSHKAKQTFY